MTSSHLLLAKGLKEKPRNHVVKFRPMQSTMEELPRTFAEAVSKLDTASKTPVNSTEFTQVKSRKRRRKDDMEVDQSAKGSETAVTYEDESLTEAPAKRLSFPPVESSITLVRI